MALPAGSYQPASISYRDAGNEIGRAEFYGQILSAANFDANVALWATLLTKTDAITLGNRVRDQYNDETTYNVGQPTNGAAREVKLMVQAKDTVNGKLAHYTIPTLDPTIPAYVVNINAKDVIEIDTPTAISDFVAAFNAFAVNPETGNALEVVGLRVVGRNV